MVNTGNKVDEAENPEEELPEEEVPGAGAAESGAEAEPGAAEGVEEPEDNGEDGTPPYLREAEPTGVVNSIKWKLLHGRTEQQLISSGGNKTTVRMCAFDLEKAGLRQRDVKTKSVATVRQTTTEIKTYATGSPPEALINSISLAFGNEEGEIFERGLKAGATLIVLGVRVAQELSNVGIQQAKPIMDMARSMREGEGLAAKDAASEAAERVGGHIANIFGPAFDRLARPVEGSDPMKAMMVRTMEPMMNRMMNIFAPGSTQAQPSGWTLTKK